MDAIEVSGLIKQYGKIEALRGVDLRVPEGTVFGLVGPNGAGKTTLIKALVGALKPTEGEVRVMGLAPLRDRAELRRHIGYMPQSPALYEDLPARENVEFFGAAHRVPELRKRIEEILDLTDLTDRAKDPVHTFSGDEPTAAVDPQLRSRFWGQFRQLAKEGATLFISTHLMDEAMLCDRISILRRGRVIASDSPRRVLERGKTHLVVSRSGEKEEKVIGGHPEDLAAALHPYGLSRDVTAVDAEADSLETVVLSLIEKEDG
jgi:ABC-2 type transport system ATP-binding protein